MALLNKRAAVAIMLTCKVLSVSAFGEDKGCSFRIAAAQLSGAMKLTKPGRAQINTVK